MLLPPLRAPESLGEHSETMQKLMFAPRTVSAHPPPCADWARLRTVREERSPDDTTAMTPYHSVPVAQVGAASGGSSACGAVSPSLKRRLNYEEI